MFQKAKEFFTYNYNERIGAMVIAGIIGGVIFGIWAYRYFTPKEEYNFDRLYALSDSLDVREKKRIAEWNNSNSTEFSAYTWEKPEELFSFNPNTLSDSGWIDLGFQEKQVQTLRNYINAGAEFRQKDDLKRLYFMEDSIYDVLKPFIELPEEQESTWENKKWNNKYADNGIRWSDTATYKPFIPEKFSVELNSADTNEIKNLYGIGSFYANKIVEYREELGGYQNIGQLLEIWNFTPGKIDTISPYLTLDVNKIKKSIKINTATAQELAKHPYLSFKVANNIVNCRLKNGNFNSLNDLQRCDLVNEEIRRKIAVYLSFTI